MRNCTQKALIYLLFLLIAPVSMGQNSTVSEIFSEKSTLQSGDQFQIAIQFEHPEEWYSYYKNPGSFGSPLEINWATPEGVTVSPIQWPTPKVKVAESFGETMTSYVYDPSVVFLFDVIVDKNANIEPNSQITADAKWQICSKTGCIPEKATLAIDFDGGELKPNTKQVIQVGRDSLPDVSKSLLVRASELNKGIILSYSIPKEIGALKKAYFFAADQQLDAQTEQSYSVSSEQVSHIAKRNRGNESFAIEAPPISDTLSGILKLDGSEGTKAYLIETALTQKGTVENNNTTSLEKETEPKTQVTEIDSSLRDQGAALYNAEIKPAFVTLDGVEEKKHSFGSALLSVFIGGLLLNLMPCVFPVLGLKVMSFVQQAGEDSSKIKMHGLVFTLGLVLCMCVIAAIVVALNANWGVQLTNPYFLAGIVTLLFVMGLNMAGVFEFGTSMTGVGGNLQMKKGYSGSFFSGVLTTLIATPCSGPFLGSAIGYALSQPTVNVFILFIIFALGIASPYLVFAFFPKLIQALPRPGAWMETFKKAMSFPLFASALFFLNGFANQTGISGTIWLLSALVVIALAVWIYGHWGTPIRKQSIRYGVGYGVALFIALGGLWMIKKSANFAKEAAQELVVSDGSLQWHPWFPGKMELAREKKQITWIDYTADWCLTCKWNKKRVFTDEKVLALLEKENIELVRADYTSGDPAIETDLKRFDRRNIPVNIVVPSDPNAPLIMMPELITPEDAIKAIQAAKG